MSYLPWKVVAGDPIISIMPTLFIIVWSWWKCLTYFLCLPYFGLPSYLLYFDDKINSSKISHGTCQFFSPGIEQIDISYVLTSFLACSNQYSMTSYHLYVCTCHISSSWNFSYLDVLLSRWIIYYLPSL